VNWTVDQLEAFVTAVKLSSFSAAARHLGKAQSRVSTAIANLEADLDITLFDRSARLPVLTLAGEDMYAEAEDVLRQCQRLQSRALTVSGGEEISLTIAMDEAAPLMAFQHLFSDIANKYPLLKINIISGSQADIGKWVDEKKADIGILFHLKTLLDSLEFMSIGKFSQTLIVAPEHPLAKIPAPKIEQLNQFRELVIRDRMGMTEAKAISPNHWHIDSYYYITELVIRGIGWALVPEHVANIHWYEGALVELSTAHITDPLLIEMGVVKRRDQASGPVMNWIYQALSKGVTK
jgi:DNA-binding transcriptional LysR family regulator